MDSYLVPPLYAAFIWWFSTGAVLLLVGLSKRFDGLRLGAAAALLIASLYGLAESRADTSVIGAYIAFTSTILLWGAQEIAFLAGWVTGPRPVACPSGVRGWQRFNLALQAILYHEFMLVACGAAIYFLTSSAANQVGLWTFTTLWVLRQSSKINLFLGVPVTNDELMPDAVRFLKSFFARKPVSAFFPISVTLATAVLVIMIQRVVEVAVTPFDIAGLTLVSTLFALGVLEHWFMLLPLPAMTLWGWGVKPIIKHAELAPADAATPIISANADLVLSFPHVVSLSVVRNESASPETNHVCAKQRLEDQFRQTFIEQHQRNDLNPVRRTSSIEPVVNFNGRTS